VRWQIPSKSFSIEHFFVQKGIASRQQEGRRTVTLEEKREASLAELLACMRQIISEDTRNLNNAKWLAATALATMATISEQGRIPSTEESVEWVKRQGWAFLN